MKRNLITLAALLTLATLLTAGQAQAGVYFGGNIGQTSVDGLKEEIGDGSLSMFDVDDSDTGYKLYAGWKFLKLVGIQLSWTDFGEVSVDAVSDGMGTFFAPGPVSATADLQGIAASAVGKIPVGKRFSLFAHVGVMAWESTGTFADTSGSSSEDDDGSDTLYGVGLSYNFAGPGSLRVEWEQLDADGTDVSLTSVGYAFKF